MLNHRLASYSPRWRISRSVFDMDQPNSNVNVRRRHALGLADDGWRCRAAAVAIRLLCFSHVRRRFLEVGVGPSEAALESSRALSAIAAVLTNSSSESGSTASSSGRPHNYHYLVSA